MCPSMFGLHKLTSYFTFAALVLSQLVSARPSSYAEWAAASAIARGQGNGLDSSGKPLVSYEHGELQWGLRLLYERTGNKTYYDYIKAGVDNIVNSDGTVGGGYSATQFQLDPLRVGPTFIYLYQQTKQAKYKKAADQFRNQLHTHSRTAQGQFWHKKIYPNQGWLDGIYMGDIFYADYTKAFQATNQTAWDDITLQFTLMYNNTIQNAATPNHTFSGLLYHGYDYSHTTVWASPDRGHSPEIWDRALGWYFMALVDILDIIPTSHPGHNIFLTQLRTLAPRLVAAADPQSGVWWLVLTQPGRAGNYFESSGAAMYVYALLKGVRVGYISDPDGKIVTAAKKAYQYMVNNWVVDNGDGTFDWKNTVQVGSLNTDGSYEYYVGVPTDVNDLKGLAAFLLASIEFEQLK
ncbi:glycoside hydrolase family 105 protein [Panus rudis PR-1116 ss-1]|nr:glycoside hydrolase family 105 protein [Panus rudis PR-1116 ss-1]